MEQYLILRSQANTIYSIIREIGLQPSDFKWTQEMSSKTLNIIVSKLEHSSSAFYFKFDFLGGAHYCEFSPGRDKRKEGRHPGSWDSQLSCCIDWLKILKLEIESPDLWGAIAQEKQLSAETEQESNKLFLPEELAKISANLSEIRQHLLSTHVFSTEQIDFITKRLDYLVESSERLGRKDWTTLLLGVLTNIIIGIALSPDAARELLRFSGNILSWLLHKQHFLP